MSLDSSSADHGGHSNIRGVPTHGGRYVQYNVHGSLFEVSRKYVPPIRPIGRGANGMVCAAVNSETREEVAIKKIGNAFDNVIDAKRTLREIKLLSHMDHENAGHRTGTNRYRTGTGRFDRVVDRYRDEPDRNYRDGGSVPSRPTIYRDGTGTDRNGPERNGMG
ncbi:hypothetical protein MTR67_024268 [Solanum verrucosum]|uniref:Protein kinase domain-containing protein n=1 Tax=Solanum verrucosum TaxID=315347 RepID=A0AAF0QX54_SOLVR|nr:hypothetical protein MTR67_024268 [Solanum verrucosum]